MMEKENEPPDEHREPKRRLSLKLPEEKKSRFDHKSKEEMEVIVKGFVPPNTEKNTPEDILERQSPEELSQWISKFTWSEVYTTVNSPDSLWFTQVYAQFK